MKMMSQSTGKLISIECSAAIHEKVGHFILSMESPASKPQPVLEAEMSEIICTCSKIILYVNSDP